MNSRTLLPLAFTTNKKKIFLNPAHPTTTSYPIIVWVCKFFILLFLKIIIMLCFLALPFCPRSSRLLPSYLPWSAKPTNNVGILSANHLFPIWDVKRRSVMTLAGELDMRRMQARFYGSNLCCQYIIMFCHLTPLPNPVQYESWKYQRLLIR